MKQVLIWDKHIALKNSGGPNGYLFNIKEYLNENPSNVVKFYSDLANRQDSNNYIQPSRANSRVKRLKCKINKILSDKFWFKIYMIYFHNQTLCDDDLYIVNQFDYVHVHLLTQFKRFYRDPRVKSKIILTTHTPEPLVDELSSESVSRFFKYFPFVRNYLIKKEGAVYLNADYLMFPVKSALEVYENASPILKKVFEKAKEKTFFVPTSIYPNEVITNNKQYTSEIDKRKLIVCYIGRHNVVKGYDSLKRLASNYLRSHDNTKFVIGGQEGPLRRIENDNWVELGWINTHQLLSEVDVFVLPNKETYFDIVALEVLRQGVPIVMTRTGGNKWYEDTNVKGTYFFEYDNYISFESAIEKIERIKKENKLEALNNEIREYFISKLSMKGYIEEYERNILSLQ